ncbi:uncharacterized protein ACIB01_012591 [Guaruba guarouba]
MVARSHGVSPLPGTLRAVAAAGADPDPRGARCGRAEGHSPLPRALAAPGAAPSPPALGLRPRAEGENDGATVRLATAEATSRYATTHVNMELQNLHNQEIMDFKQSGYKMKLVRCRAVVGLWSQWLWDGRATQRGCVP